MANTHYLKTSINFHNRELDIELRGVYTPYRKATYMDPPEGDEMELTEVVIKRYTKTDSKGVEHWVDEDITWMFIDEELNDFCDQLYTNGEEIV